MTAEERKKLEESYQKHLKAKNSSNLSLLGDNTELTQREKARKSYNAYQNTTKAEQDIKEYNSSINDFSKEYDVYNKVLGFNNYMEQDRIDDMRTKAYNVSAKRDKAEKAVSAMGNVFQRNNMLGNIKNQKEAISDSISDLRNQERYSSQFDNLEQHNNYVNYQNLLKKYESYDISSAEKQIQDLESRLEQVNKARKLSQTTDNYDNANDEIKELTEQINTLKGEVEPAKLYQKQLAVKNSADFAEMAEAGRGVDVQAPFFGIGSDEQYSRSNANKAINGVALGDTKVSYAGGFTDGQTKYENLNAMTDEEKNIYNYLLAKEGEDSAFEYLNGIQDSLNYRGGTGIANAVNNIDNGILKGVAQQAMDIPIGIEQFKTGLQQIGKSEALPTSALEYAQQQIYDNTEWGPELFGKNLGQVFHDINTNIANMAPSLAAGAINPALGALSIGASAGGQAYRQALQEGLDVDSAGAYGVLTGASEALLEKLLGGISLLGGKASKSIAPVFAAKVDGAIKKTAVKLGISSLGEFSEEYLQEVLDPVFRNLCFDEKNNIKLFSEDALYSGLLGAITAGVVESPTAVSTSINERQIGNTYKKGGADSLINEGLAMPESSEAYKLAGELSVNFSKGKNVSSKSLYELARLNNDAIREQTVKQVPDVLKNNGVSENESNAVSQVFTKLLSGESVTDKEISTIADNDGAVKTLEQLAGKKLTAENVAEMAEKQKFMFMNFGDDVFEPKNNADVVDSSDVSKTSETTDNVVMPQNSTQRPSVKSSVFIAPYVNEDTDTAQISHSALLEGSPVEVSSISGTDGESTYVTLSDGGVANINDLQFENKATALIYQAAADYPVNAAKSFVFGYTGQTDTATYARTFRNIYNTAATGVPYEQIQKSYSLGIKQIGDMAGKYAYFAGENASRDSRTAYNKGIAKSISKQNVKNKGTVHSNNNDTDSAIFKMSEYIANKTKYDVELVRADSNIQGEFRSSEGRIIININSQNPFATVLHETTHFIEINSPKDFDKMKRFIANWIMKSGNGEKIISDYISRYGEQLGDVSVDDVMAEITADSAEAMLYKEGFLETIFSSEDFVSDFALQDRTLFEKILDKIKSVITTIKEYVKRNGVNSSVAKQLSEETEVLTEFVDMWSKALDNAQKNYEKKADENKNSADVKDSGEVKYSIKYTTDNKPVVVVEENILEGVPKSEWVKTVKNVISDKFSGGIPVSGRLIKVNAVTRNEFTKSKDSQKASRKNETIYKDKFKSANNLDEIVLASTNYVNEDLNHERKDNFKEFARGDVLVRVGNTDYFAKVIVGFNSQNKMVLYDIIGFTPTKFGKIKVGTQFAASSQNANSSSNVPTSYNVPQNDTVVNSNIRKNIENDTEKGKFSLGENVEESKNLVAVHNLSVSKLAEVLELGGFPMPSIAIIKAQMEHNGYGDVSVVFGKETIDPEFIKKNKVYSADAYTARFPQVDYKYNEKELKKISEKFGKSVSDLEANYFDGASKESVIKKLSYDHFVRELFIKENNIDVVPVLHKPKYQSFSILSNDNVKSFLIDNNITFEQLVNDKTIRDEFTKQICNTKHPMRLNLKFADKYNNLLDLCADDKALYGAVNQTFETDIQIAKGVSEMVEDEYSYQEGVTNAINEHSEDFEKWLDSIVAPAIEDKYIRNNKEAFMSNGNRRNFNQLHEEFTLENIVRNMQSGTNAESNLFAGIGEVRAAVSKQFDSIQSIKENADRLQQLSDEDIQAAYDKSNLLLDEISKELAAVSYVDNKFSAINIAIEEVANALKKYKTAATIKKYLSSSFKTVSDGTVTKILRLAEEMRNVPVKYFEAKPERAVGFDEVKCIVVPDDTDSKLVSQMENNGISVLKYEKGSDKSRADVINRLEDVKFSLKETSDVDYMQLLSENKKLKETVSTLREQMKITKGHKVSEKAVESLANKYIKSVGSEVHKDVLAKDLTNIFNYMASDYAAAETAQEALTGVAKNLLEKSVRKNSDVYNEWKDVRKLIKDTTIRVSDDLKSQIEYSYGRYGDFKNHNFGSMSLSRTEGRSIDDLWQTLSEQYPAVFAPETYSEIDMIEGVSDFLDSIKPVYENPYKADIDTYAAIVASEMFDNYFATPEIRTFADKKQAEMQKLINESRKKLADVKQEAKARYDKKIDKIRESNQNKVNALMERMSKAQEGQKDYYRKRISDIRSQKNEQLDRQRAMFRDRAKAKSENQKNRKEQAKYKESIKNNSRTIIKWFNENSDKHHIPEAMRKTTAEFISSIDFVSDNAKPDSANTLFWRTALNNMYVEISQAEKAEDDIDDIFIDNMDPDFLPTLYEFIKANQNVKKLSELDTEQLRELDFLVKMLKRSIVTVNKMYSNRLSKEIAVVGNDTILDLQSKKDKNNPHLNKIDKLLNIDMLDSRSFFYRLGNTSFSIYNELRDGFNNRVWSIRQAQDFVDTIASKKDFSEWEKQKDNVHTFNIYGTELKLTTAQIMSLYMLWKRPQARKHILEGGIKADKIDGNKKNQVQPVRIDFDNYVKICDVLTKEQKKVAEALQSFMAVECAEWGNKVSMEMYGYKKFTEKDYFPISSDKNQVKTNDQTENTASLYAVRNQGMTKALNKKANNAIVVSDIFDVFTNHVCDMANYNAFAIPLTDAMKWYNYRNRSNGKSVKAEIERAYGGNAKSYFVNLMKDINGEIAKGYASEISNSLVSKFKSASVGANLRVAIQQPTAYLRAVAVMKPKYLAKPVWDKNAIKLVKQYSAIAQWKSWGYFETNIGKSMKNVITGQRSLLENITDKSMKLAQLGDDITWAVLWNACCAEIKDTNKDLEYKSDAFYKKVAERFDDVIDQTQTVDTVLHRSQFMRSSNGLVKLEAAFMSEPTKSYNLLYNAFTDVKESGFKENKSHFARVAIAFFATGILTSAAAALCDAARGNDDDDDFAENYLKSLSANLIDNTNPFSMIPYFKDVMSFIDGYDSDRIDVAGISNIITSAKQILKMFTDESYDKSLYDVLYKLSQGLSQVTGVPLYNVIRDVKSLFAVTTNSYDTPAVAKYDKMLEVLKNGDTQGYTRRFNELLAQGKTRQQIEVGIRKALSESDSRIKEAAFLKMDNDIKSYSNLVLEIKADTGLTQDMIVQTINNCITTINNDKEKTETESIPIVEVSSDEILTDESTGAIYSNDNLYEAVKSRDSEKEKIIYDDIYASKVKYYIDKGDSEKEAEKKATSAIKTALTTHFKPIAKDFYDNKQNKEFNDLRKYLIMHYGYTAADINRWTIS